MPRLKWRKELRAVCLGVGIVSGLALVIAGATQHPLWGGVFAVAVVVYLVTNVTDEAG